MNKIPARLSNCQKAHQSGQSARQELARFDFCFIPQHGCVSGPSNCAICMIYLLAGWVID